MSLIDPTFFERHKAACIIAALVLVLIIGGLLWWAYSGTGKNGEVPILTNIGIDAGKNAIQSNLIANQEKVVENVEIKANKANANLANSLKRDSNVYSGNADETDDNYCGHYPCDSSCDAWRSRTGRTCPR